MSCYDYPGRTVLPSMDLLRSGTPVGRLLSKVSCLPAEIQFQIMGLLKGTMVASLIQTETFVSELLPHLHNQSSRKLHPQREPLQAGREGSNVSPYCRTTEIVGKPYLSRLALTPCALEGSAARLVVAKTAVRGVQFALGWFGLRGIRILYKDGSFSPWLGDSTSSCWIGTVRCSFDSVNSVFLSLLTKSLHSNGRLSASTTDRTLPLMAGPERCGFEPLRLPAPAHDCSRH